MKWSSTPKLGSIPNFEDLYAVENLCNRLGRQGRTGFPQLGHENFIYLFIYRSYARCGCLIYAHGMSWMDLF